MSSVAVLLAAGKSTRMNSELPKVLHPICGRPLIEYVLDAARDAGANRTIVVVGHKAEMVQDALSKYDDVEFALQSEQLGTGHAVMMCEQSLANHQGSVLVLAADTPLLQGSSLQELVQEQQNQKAACVIGTAVTRNNFGLGRVVRDDDDEFVKIVEQRDATEAEQRIQEINTGCYVFDGPKLLASLKKLKPENVQAEYYLTDCPSILMSEGERVAALASLDINEAMGVNTRVQLADVTRVIQARIQEAAMVAGVTIVSPGQTYIGPNVVFGQDTVIHPQTYISGPATIGANCEIGPFAMITAGAEIPDGTTIGPFQTH